MNRAEIVLLEAAKQQRRDPKKLQTRRQTKGIVYFDRLKPKVQIGIGTLDDWYQERYVNEHKPPAKRRRFNYTTDDIQIDLSQDEEDEDYNDDDQIELNKTVEAGINKTLLYDGWIKDY